MKSIERRFLSTSTGGAITTEARASGQTRIVGYAAVFNVLSEDLGGFREIIRPGAFSHAITSGQDVRGTFNHDKNVVLGRTSVGTMRLSEDAKGLRYEIDVPSTYAAHDVVELLKRGDVSGSSFTFSLPDAPDADYWRAEPDGSIVREVLQADLYDVGPVTYPAYTATVSEAAKRSLEQCKQAAPVEQPSRFPIRDAYKARLAARERAFARR